MALDPALRDCLNQRVWLAKLGGVSSDGDPQYGQTVAFLARVVPERKVKTNASGEEVVSEFVLYTETDIRLHDRVWLPGEDHREQANSRLPQSVEAGVDEDGTTTHFEVLI